MKRNSPGSILHSNDLALEESGGEKIDEEIDHSSNSRHNKRFCSRKNTDEQKRKGEEEAHLHTIIKVSRDDNLHEQIGKTIFFDLVDHETVHSFRITNQTSFVLFKVEVAKELGIPMQCQRFWLWADRQNKTYRPYRPLTPLQESYCVGQLRTLTLSNKENNAEVKLFLETEHGHDAQPIPPPVITEDNILLFFKLYDPLEEKLSYLGRFFVNVRRKPTEILAKLIELAGFELDEEIELFEEVNFEPVVMCKYVDKNLTFQANQLENGDIICFQRRLEAQTENCRYPDVPSFLEYARNRKNRDKFLETS